MTVRRRINTSSCEALPFRRRRPIGERKRSEWKLLELLDGVGTWTCWNMAKNLDRVREHPMPWHGGTALNSGGVVLRYGRAEESESLPHSV